MAKPPSPLVGFNNNVKHLGRIYHVQTEDSGVKRPHIVTHLFVDGGRIIKSTRTDYSAHIGQADMNAVVRRLMKDQHKAMFIALRDGQLDNTIVDVLGPAEEKPRGSRSPPPIPSRRKSRPAPTAPEMRGARPTPAPSAVKIESPAKPPVPKPAAPTLTDLVLADLEAARARKGNAAPPERPAPKGGTPVLGTPPVSSRPAMAGRYGASRPAAIFSAPGEQASIFGGSSISEQSLDEVILSYLAEDLETPPEE